MTRRRGTWAILVRSIIHTRGSGTSGPAQHSTIHYVRYSHYPHVAIVEIRSAVKPVTNQSPSILLHAHKHIPSSLPHSPHAASLPSLENQSPMCPPPPRTSLFRFTIPFVIAILIQYHAHLRLQHVQQGITHLSCCCQAICLPQSSPFPIRRLPYSSFQVTNPSTPSRGLCENLPQARKQEGVIVHPRGSNLRPSEKSFRLGTSRTGQV